MSEGVKIDLNEIDFDADSRKAFHDGFLAGNMVSSLLSGMGFRCLGSPSILQIAEQMRRKTGAVMRVRWNHDDESESQVFIDIEPQAGTGD